MAVRRRGSTVAIGMAVLLAVAACGSDSDENPTEGADATSGEPVNLRFAGWDPNQAPAMEKVIEAFEAENEAITVEYQVIPFNDYANKMQVQASAGNPPDVFWMTPGMVELYASEGVAAPLDELAADGSVDVSSYAEAALAQQEYDGKLYAFPRGAATTELWFNKELFAAAGVDLPTEDWTWDDMIAAAAELTDTANGVYGLTALFDGTQSYYNSIFQAGGYIISEDGKSAGFDDPKTIEGIRLWTDLIEAGSTPKYSTTLETPPDALFMSGKAAMIWAGSWFPGVFAANADIKDKIDVMPLPSGPEGRGTVLGANGYGMAASSEHPDAAWKFLSFLAGPDGLAIQANSPTVVQPPTAESAEVWAGLFPEYNMQAVLDAASYATPFPASKLSDEWQVSMKDALAKAFDLTQSPEEASAAADKAIEDVLAKESG